MAQNTSLDGGQLADARRYSVSLRNRVTGSSTISLVPSPGPPTPRAAGRVGATPPQGSHKTPRLPRPETFVCSSNGSVVVCLVVALILLRAPHPFH
jgi:hypothetical protein